MTTYRTSHPPTKCDLVIVSLIHQSSETVFSMARNIKKYVKGSFMWIVHYNNPEAIDENDLPEWAWLTRTTTKTDRYSISLMFAINKTLDFVFENSIKFTNILTLSSSSAFFREFTVPTGEVVCARQHFFQRKEGPQHDLISTEYAGNCGSYLRSIGSTGWHYGADHAPDKWGADFDTDFQTKVKKRKFKYFLECQWPGQMFPYEVAKMLNEDVSEIFKKSDQNDEDYLFSKNNRYDYESIYLSTYSCNYARDNNLPIGKCQVITDEDQYFINSVEHLREYIYDSCAISSVIQYGNSFRECL